MSTRPLLIVLLIAVSGLNMGCATPTHGEQARIDARRRMNSVNAAITYDQAEQAFKTGQFDDALKNINACLEAMPDQPKYHLLQGRIHLETHRLEKAIKSFQSALEQQSEFADAHYFSGIVYQRWSDDEKAHEQYRAAYELELSAVGYLLAAAESLVALGRVDEAKRLVEQKLDYFEHNPALRQLLGQIALLQDDPETAAMYLAEASRFNPDDLLLLEEVAHAQFAAGLYVKCLDSTGELRRAIHERRPDLVHLEARCLAQLQRFEDAREAYLQLTRLTPRDVEVWVDLGVLAWEMDDFHRMALCGARLASLAPQRYEGYLLKGINERHHGNLREAIALLQRAASLAPDTALPQLVLGRVLDEAGDRDGAQAAVRMAIQAEPENGDAKLMYVELSQDHTLVTVPSPEQAH